MKLVATSSQTIGPFFKHALEIPIMPVQGGATNSIEIHGHLFDAQGSPVSDGVLEFWQCGSDGRFAGVPETAKSPYSPGFTRLFTGPTGEFEFKSVKPGVAPGSRSAPHLAVVLFARGLLRHIYTRIYFDGEKTNLSDPVLMAIPADRRTTLLARSEGLSGKYSIDLHLGGPRETVFFTY